MVYTDDPVNPEYKLVLSGFIENFMDVKPKGLIRLVGHLGDSIKQTVTIVPSEKYQFQITEIKADNGQNIKFELSRPDPGQNRYILTIENTKTTEGRYFDSLVLKTTNTLKPEFSLRIFGDVRPPKNPEVKPDVKKDTN